MSEKICEQFLCRCLSVLMQNDVLKNSDSNPLHKLLEMKQVHLVRLLQAQIKNVSPVLLFICLGALEC